MGHNVYNPFAESEKKALYKKLKEKIIDGAAIFGLNEKRMVGLVKMLYAPSGNEGVSDNSQISKEVYDRYWTQFEYNNSLYKFYFDLFLKINVFYYAVTGSILAFYFSHIELAQIRYSLFLPIGISLILMILFHSGKKMIGVIGTELEELAKRLELRTYTDTSMLKKSMTISSIFYFLVSSFLLFSFFYY